VNLGIPRYNARNKVPIDSHRVRQRPASPWN
jgi:hypothetical protein